MFDALISLLSRLVMLSLRLEQTGSFPPSLSPDEEHRLLLSAGEGDISARNKLIEHNLRLVAHVIKKYYAVSGDQDDLISIGIIGLIKAINTFDPNKNTRLATYAARCVENAILSQRNKLNLAAKTSHHVAKNGAYSVTYADTDMS